MHCLYINRGRILPKMNQFVLARADFNHAKALEPERIEIYYLIGNSFFYEKQFERAAAYYNQYLTADPTNGMVWYNGAMSYLELEQQRGGLCRSPAKGKYSGNAAGREGTKEVLPIGFIIFEV